MVQSITYHEKIEAVCKRLQIITSMKCDDLGMSYERDMLMLIKLLVEHEICDADKKMYGRILTRFITLGMRHCDLFDIAYRIIFEYKCLDDACIDLLLERSADDLDGQCLELQSYRDIIDSTYFG